MMRADEAKVCDRCVTETRTVTRLFCSKFPRTITKRIGRMLVRVYEIRFELLIAR